MLDLWLRLQALLHLTRPKAICSDYLPLPCIELGVVQRTRHKIDTFGQTSSHSGKTPQL